MAGSFVLEEVRTTALVSSGVFAMSAHIRFRPESD
jgi:hypothetical protein